MSVPDPNPSPSAFVRAEATALHALADRLDGALAPHFERAIALILTALDSGHSLIVTGVGKSGLIAQKIASTLRSTGTPAHFLHPTEALHGDLGILTPGDLALALSYSGETEELLRLLPPLERLNVPVIALCGCTSSTLALTAAITLDCSVDAEACTHNLAPTASTTVMLALGDTLALELSRRRHFTPHHFADLHPAGRLGRRLARVRDLMHTGDALPRVTPNTPMPQVIHEMSSKRLGMTTVLTTAPTGALTLAGIIADGDLRRLLERVGPRALERTAGEIMNRTPQTIPGATLATEALAHMEAHKITSLVVVDHAEVQGVVHLHDLWQTQN